MNSSGRASLCKGAGLVPGLTAEIRLSASPPCTFRRSLRLFRIPATSPTMNIAALRARAMRRTRRSGSRVCLDPRQLRADCRTRPRRARRRVGFRRHTIRNSGLIESSVGSGSAAILITAGSASMRPIQSVSAPSRGQRGWFDHLLARDAGFSVTQDARSADTDPAAVWNPAIVRLNVFREVRVHAIATLKSPSPARSGARLCA